MAKSLYPWRVDVNVSYEELTALNEGLVMLLKSKKRKPRLLKQLHEVIDGHLQSHFGPDSHPDPTDN